jgi:ribonuclease P protein component
VRRTGSRRRVGGVLVFTAAGTADGPRVAIVASRRVGSAVRRNRAKRRLREALSRVPLRNDREYVVVADSAVAEVPFSELVDWVRDATRE